MSESTLTLGFADLKLEVADFLGFGRDSTKWSTKMVATVEACIASGLRQFYSPPPLPGRPTVHQWSFLRPVTTIVTVIGTADYNLPDDFGGIVGRPTFAAADNVRSDVKVVPEYRIRQRRQQSPDLTGTPRLAAVRWKASDGTTGQRSELMLWPTPDAVCTMTYCYRALPNKLTTAAPYTLGGMDFTETILASCLAVAEGRKDGDRGVQYANFMERLTASVLLDEQNGSADTIGHLGDVDTSSEPMRTHVVTYNGTEY